MHLVWYAMLNLLEVKMIKYTLYIGLNDRDTLISLDVNKSISIINEIFNGYKYTYFIANGMSLSLEHTLVYILFDIEEDVLKNIIDKILIMLNQESICVEMSKVNCEFINNKL